MLLFAVPSARAAPLALIVAERFGSVARTQNYAKPALASQGIPRGSPLLKKGLPGNIQFPARCIAIARRTGAESAPFATPVGAPLENSPPSAAFLHHSEKSKGDTMTRTTREVLQALWSVRFRAAFAVLLMSGMLLSAVDS